MTDSAPIRLLVTKVEASKKISAQIKTGKQILQSVSVAFLPHELDPALDKRFKQAQADQEKWAKYTIHLLRTLFSVISISREFGDYWIHYPDHEDMIEVFEEQMNERIRCLESIIERLPLFPLGSAPAKAKAAPAPTKQQSKDIFIVHGHDEAAKHEVARVIEKLGLHPIILHEQADRGRTVIEKFEAHAVVGFAVVLLTPDDMGYPKDNPSEAKPRARQNVVLELGYFSGILGRANVCALLKGDIEIPSNYAGVLYTPMDNAGAWKVTLAREINAAGIDVDLKKLL